MRSPSLTADREIRNRVAELMVEPQGPLVSVVIRTTFRPELEDALVSVKAQLYRPLEVVLVDATGRGECPPFRLDDIPLRFVSQGKALGRARAANAGLAAAAGKFVCFLDEDDFLARTHLLALVAALLRNGACQVAYSGARTVGRDGGEIRFLRPFSRARLLMGNYIPIHAALFSRDVAAGCAFDESLDVFEDWDFFLQLAEKTDFLFVPRVTAFYRASGTSAAGAAVPYLEKGPAWRKAQKKWLQAKVEGWDPRAAQELERLELELDRRQKQLEALRQQLSAVEEELAWVKGSRIWRYSALPRALWRKIRGRPSFAPSPAGEATAPWVPSAAAPLVSVVLPLFRVANRPKLLAQAISSVVEQEYPDVELVVVDDGSGDGSFELAADLCRELPIPATVFSKTNGGQSAARNFGVSQARGEWVAFLDQDDVYHPWRLTAVAHRLAPDIDLVYTDIDTMREDGTPLWHRIHALHGCGGPHPIVSVEEAMTRDVFVVPGVMTVRRSFFMGLGGFDEALSGYEDDDLFCRALERGRVAYVATPTLRWRMHGASASFTERMVGSRLRYWDKLEAKARERGNRKLLRRIRRRFLREFCRQTLWCLKDGSPVFDTSLEGLRDALRRVGWLCRVEVGLTWMPFFWLARRSQLVRRAIRTPRADWELSAREQELP